MQTIEYRIVFRYIPVRSPKSGGFQQRSTRLRGPYPQTLPDPATVDGHSKTRSRWSFGEQSFGLEKIDKVYSEVVKEMDRAVSLQPIQSNEMVEAERSEYCQYETIFLLAKSELGILKHARVERPFAVQSGQERRRPAQGQAYQRTVVSKKAEFIRLHYDAGGGCPISVGKCKNLIKHFYGSCTCTKRYLCN